MTRAQAAAFMFLIVAACQEAAPSEAAPSEATPSEEVALSEEVAPSEEVAAFELAPSEIDPSEAAPPELAQAEPALMGSFQKERTVSQLNSGGVNHLKPSSGPVEPASSPSAAPSGEVDKRRKSKRGR